ncbi:MAG: restriction endonuclease subunit S, partial [Clostridiales bacterium]|nr:restriction endonuclease subunit S [Clostridiales bacterium]
PLPPLAEQKRIVEKVDELFALIDELDSNKEDLLEVINLTRNQVLQEAIQGKLVEQNPEDEPASVLLDRIKEERDNLVKEGKIRKEKPLAEITEEEKPFELPEGWEWVRLGEVGQIVGGGTPKTSVKEYWEGGTIPWLTPADLSNYKDKYISTGKRSITPLGLKESSAQLMPKGTVLFSSRAPIGYTVIAKNEISTNQGFKSCVPLIIEMNEYLYYYLIYSAKIINENASGTTFKEVSGAEVSNLILPLPPLTEQKRIVEKVDMIMNMLDELEKTII